MKSCIYSAFVALFLFSLASCSQDGKLTEEIITQYEKEYQQIIDSLDVIDEIIKANQMGLNYPITGGRGQGGVLDMIPEYQLPNPLEGLSEERQIMVKQGFAEISEALNGSATQSNTLRTEIYALFSDLGRLRAALTDDSVDDEIKALHLSVQERLARFHSETTNLDSEITKIQEKNLTYLQSDEVLKNGYSWLLASSPRN